MRRREAGSAACQPNKTGQERAAQNELYPVQADRLYLQPGGIGKGIGIRFFRLTHHITVFFNKPAKFVIDAGVAEGGWCGDRIISRPKNLPKIRP